MRQRHLRLDLLRRVTDQPAALVRHGDVRQPGQGGPPSRPRAGGHRRAEDAPPAPDDASPDAYSAGGTWASTDWIAWTAPIRAADSAGMTIFVFGLSANLLSVSSWRMATSVGFGFWAVIAP